MRVRPVRVLCLLSLACRLERDLCRLAGLLRGHGGGESVSSSPARRQVKETPLSSTESPHKAGESPQMGEDGAPGGYERQLKTPRISHLPVRSPGGRQGIFKSSNGSGDLGAREGMLGRPMGVGIGA